MENRQTKETKLLSTGTQAIVQGNEIRIINISQINESSQRKEEVLSPLPSRTKKKGLLLQSQQGLSMAVSSSVPISVRMDSSKKIRPR